MDLENFRYRLHAMEKDLIRDLTLKLLAGTDAHQIGGMNPLEAYRAASGEVCMMLQHAMVEAGHRAAEASGAYRWYEQQAVPSYYVNPAGELHLAQDLIDACYREKERVSHERIEPEEN